MDPLLSETILYLVPQNAYAQFATSASENQRFCEVTNFGGENRPAFCLSFRPLPRDVTQGFVFGRDSTHCDILLPGLSPSGRHFRINLSASGIPIVINESGDDICVGNHHLRTPGTTRVLEAGALVRWGLYDFTAVYPERGPLQASYEENLKRHLGRILSGVDALVFSVYAGPISVLEVIGDYAIIEYVESGDFEFVGLVVDLNTGRAYAAKAAMSEDRTMADETAIHSDFAHPNITRILGAITIGRQPAMLLEYAPGGSLKQQAYLTYDEVFETMSQVALAVVSLHEKDIVHQEIRPENVVILSRVPLVVKVIDFTVAITGPRFRAAVDKIDYAAPEILDGKPPYTSAVDVWSLGLTLLWMLEKFPVKEARACRTSMDQPAELVRARYMLAISRKASAMYDKPWGRLLCGMLQQDPDQRLSAQACLKEITKIKVNLDNPNELVGRAAAEPKQSPEWNEQGLPPPAKGMLLPTEMEID